MVLASAPELLAEAWSEGIRPDPELTVTEWADEHRVLSSVSSREAGPWRTSRTPYLREVMDALSAHSPVHTVVLLKGAQVGGTEVVLNWVGYTVSAAPVPMIVVQPTVDLAQRFSRQRVETMTADSPALADRLATRKSRDSANTTLYKAFPGGLLALVGANSGAGLRSMPAGRIALDEVDAYPLDVDGEGDPVELAKRALRSYGRRAKGLYVSTPTIAGRSRIEREYLLGDQSEYHVPCPHCEHLQTLAWPRMEWDDDDPEHVWMRCEACDERIEEHHKPQILADGVWVPKYPERSSSIRSFKLPGLYAPLGMYSWAESARKFRKGKKDPAVLRVWTNHDLAETWTEKGELPEWEELYRRRERTEPGRVPEGGLVLTAGADVQANRIEVEIVAWGEGMQSWSVDYVVIPGNPAEREVWSDLHGLLEHPWPSTLGMPLRIERLAIDSGYAQQYVLAWTRTQSQRRVMAVRGDDRYGVLLSIPKAVDVSSSGRRLKRGAQVWNVGGGLAKEELYGWLRQKPPLHPEEDGWPRGWCHLPDRDEEWYRQLCSEQLVNRVVNGKRRYLWEKVRERNEALDCRVYARAAAAQIGIDRWGDAEWKAHRERMAQLASPVDTPKRRGQRSDNFLDRWGD